MKQLTIGLLFGLLSVSVTAKDNILYYIDGDYVFAIGTKPCDIGAVGGDYPYKGVLASEPNKSVKQLCWRPNTKKKSIEIAEQNMMNEKEYFQIYYAPATWFHSQEYYNAK